jgi:hypothetical protein
MENDDIHYRREMARLKYRPERIKTLLITEAPSESSDSFFYFEQVKRYDQLYVSIMKVLYPDIHIGELREGKATFLQKFKEDGFYIVDAVDRPFTHNDNNKRRTRIVWENRHDLTKKISPLVSEDTEIILIKCTVYELRNHLQVEGYRVINRCPIESPGSCHNTEFNIKFKGLIRPGLDGRTGSYTGFRYSDFITG